MDSMPINWGLSQGIGENLGGALSGLATMARITPRARAEDAAKAKADRVFGTGLQSLAQPPVQAQPIGDAVQQPPQGATNAMGAIAPGGPGAPTPAIPQPTQTPAQQPASAPAQGNDPFGHISDEDLISVLRDGNSSPEDRQLALSIYQPRQAQRAQANDPEHALDMKYKQAQIDALGAKGGDEFVSAGDGRVFNKRTGQMVDNGQALGGDPNMPQGADPKEWGKLQTQKLARRQAALDAGLQEGTPAFNNYMLGRPPVQNKPLTQDQSNAAGFGDRMAQAEKSLEGLGDVAASRGQGILNSVPLIGNSLVSEDKQRLEQAKKNFITAQLRKESGAAISEGEFATGDQMYFPQPGDGPKVIADKAETRRLAIQNMKRAASNAPSSVDGGQEQPQGGEPMATATNPETGETLIYNGTAWVPQ